MRFDPLTLYIARVPRDRGPGLISTQRTRQLSRGSAAERAPLIVKRDGAETPSKPQPPTPAELEAPIPGPKRPTRAEMRTFLVGMSLMYAYIGLQDFARLAITFFEKDYLKLTPARAQAIDSSSTFPWMVKPLYGFISDFMPIFGYRRRPYLYLSSSLVVATFILLSRLSVDSANPAAVIAKFMGLMVLNQIGVCFTDVICDSLVVQKIGEKAPYSNSLQSFVWASRTTGSMFASWSAGYVLDRVPPQAVFRIAALFPAAVFLSATFLVSETRVPSGGPKQPDPAPAPPPAPAPAAAGAATPIVEEEEDESKFTLAQQLQRLRGALTEPTIWRSTVFIFLVAGTPSCDTAMLYFFTNKLGFQNDKEFFGRVNLVTNIASITGIFVFQRYLRNVRLRRIILSTSLIGTLLQLLPIVVVTRANLALGLSDKLFVLGSTGINAVCGQISFMPILVLAAKVCPRGIEGTLFAFLMSIMNSAGLVSSYLGAFFTSYLGVTPHNFDKLWALVLICSLSTAAPLVLLKTFVPDYRPDEGEGEADHGHAHA